jgi:hypothetical protein
MLTKNFGFCALGFLPTKKDAQIRSHKRNAQMVPERSPFDLYGRLVLFGAPKNCEENDDACGGCDNLDPSYQKKSCYLEILNKICL